MRRSRKFRQALGLLGRACLLVICPATLASDFDVLCSDPNVVRCYGFDSAPDIAPRIFPPSGGGAQNCTNNQCWAMDTSVKVSGAGSLRFEIPSNSGADSSGSFFMNFRDDLSQQFGPGQTFFVQFRQRVHPNMLQRFLTADGSNTGWKQIIVGEGDQPGLPTVYSCTELELVLSQNGNYMGPFFYHSCGRFISLDYHDGTQVRLQHQGPPYCYYPNDPQNGCFRYQASEWMTYQYQVTIGTWNTPSSRIKIWAARENQPSVLIYDTINSHPNGFTLYNNPGSGSGTNPGARYGKLWLTPYMTQRNSSISYGLAYTWYDDLIISRTRIPDPGPASQPPGAPANLRPQ